MSRHSHKRFHKHSYTDLKVLFKKKGRALPFSIKDNHLCLKTFMSVCLIRFFWQSCLQHVQSSVTEHWLLDKEKQNQAFFWASTAVWHFTAQASLIKLYCHLPLLYSPAGIKSPQLHSAALLSDLSSLGLVIAHRTAAHTSMACGDLRTHEHKLARREAECRKSSFESDCLFKTVCQHLWPSGVNRWRGTTVRLRRQYGELIGISNLYKNRLVVKLWLLFFKQSSTC